MATLKRVFTLRMEDEIFDRIEQLAKEKFGDLEGIAQQYLFYWKRENS